MLLERHRSTPGTMDALLNSVVQDRIALRLQRTFERVWVTNQPSENEFGQARGAQCAVRRIWPRVLVADCQCLSKDFIYYDQPAFSRD